MQTTPVVRTAESVLATNKVLRNTYALLSMTLVFSALMALLSMSLPVGPGMALVASIVGILTLMFVLPRFEESAAGIGIVFLGTGLLGFGIGPMLSYYLALPNGASVVATAMGGTGAIFLGLSGYALTTRKDFSFMGGALFAALIGVFVLAIVGMFLQMPALNLFISFAIIMLMSGFILFDTSRIINGGETNYIRATVSLFINIFNIFTSLLHILGIMGDE